MLTSFSFSISISNKQKHGSIFSSLKPLLIFAVLLAYLLVQSRVRPFHMTSANRFESFLLFCAMLIYLYVSLNEIDTTASSTPSVIFTVAIVAYVVTGVYFLYLLWRARGRVNNSIKATTATTNNKSKNKNKSKTTTPYPSLHDGDEEEEDLEADQKFNYNRMEEDADRARILPYQGQDAQVQDLLRKNEELSKENQKLLQEITQLKNLAKWTPNIIIIIISLLS